MKKDGEESESDKSDIFDFLASFPNKKINF